METALKDRLMKMGENATHKSRSNGTIDKSKITQLILDGYSFSTITPKEKNMLKEFTSLVKLSCNQTGLSSLENFPSCQTLKTLELTDNHLKNNLGKLHEICPNVRKLELGGNHIENFEDITPLEKLSCLEQLGLDLNPIASHANYKQKIWELLPNVKIIDGCDKHGIEVDENTDDDDDECEESDYDEEEVGDNDSRLEEDEDEDEDGVDHGNELDDEEPRGEEEEGEDESEDDDENEEGDEDDDDDDSDASVERGEEEENEDGDGDDIDEAMEDGDVHIKRNNEDLADNKLRKKNKTNN